jgi:hypothetical protein
MVIAQGKGAKDLIKDAATMRKSAKKESLLASCQYRL